VRGTDPGGRNLLCRFLGRGPTRRPSHPSPLNRNDSLAESKARWHNAYAAEGVSVPTGALFGEINYGSRDPERLSHGCESCCYEPVPEAECRVALEECLRRGWLQLIDQPALARIVNDLRRTGTYGPVGGLPHLGTVDFTAEGAAVWQRACRRANPTRLRGWMSRTVRQHLAHYFPSARLARRWCEEELWTEDRVIAGPTNIGAWGAYANCWRVNTAKHGCGGCEYTGTHEPSGYSFDGEYCWADTFRVEHQYAECESVLWQPGPLDAPPDGRRVVSRTVPLGRWCIRWWEHFESGVRGELEIGDPSATDAN
jgi:hypothetical protein